MQSCVLIYRPRRDRRLSWPSVAGWLHTKISQCPAPGTEPEHGFPANPSIGMYGLRETCHINSLPGAHDTDDISRSWVERSTSETIYPKMHSDRRLIITYDSQVCTFTHVVTL